MPLNPLSIEAQAKRIEYIRFAESSVKKCARRHRIYDYIPGQVVYHLLDYPCKGSLAPIEYDYQRVKMLAQKGVGLIQLHSDWIDFIRHLGGHNYESHDPAGVKQFIDLCHENGIKIIPYTTTGFLQMTDPDMRSEFRRCDSTLHEVYYNLAYCSAESPEWRAYVLPAIQRILDEYGFDGLYNDAGYDKRSLVDGTFYDPALEDEQAQIYQMIHDRGGIFKLHVSGNTPPPVKDKIYDYLWVGEGVRDVRTWKKLVHFPPYVMPCPDYRRIEGEVDEDIVYAVCIPMMQFPTRPDGRPLLGINADVPGIEYADEICTHYLYQVREYVKTHPNGPHIYSEWSGTKPRPLASATWEKYMALYQPMVQNNSVCHLDIQEASIFPKGLPNDVHASLFTNHQQYLAISNFGFTPCEVPLDRTWRDRMTGMSVSCVHLEKGRIALLERM